MREDGEGGQVQAGTERSGAERSEAVPSVVCLQRKVVGRRGLSKALP